MALARGAELAGTGICSGEGGLLPEEQQANSRYFYELASAQFGCREELLPLVPAGGRSRTMHGEADVRAPFRQFELVVDILEREGKTYEARSYPGEPHGFRHPMNRVDMHQRLELWFDRWLHGPGIRRP